MILNILYPVKSAIEIGVIMENINRDMGRVKAA